MPRRRFLAALGASITSGIAGCNAGTEGNTATPDDGQASVETGAGSSTDSWSVDPIEQDKLVGAFYYPWYWGENGYAIHRDRPWIEHSPFTPELGQYDSRDPAVINQHVKWALEAGVNWFVINTGHPGGPIMESIRESFLETSLSDQMSYAFDVGFDHGPVTDEDGRYVVDAPENLAEHRRYFETYAEFFDDPNFVRFDGRPVLFDFSTARLTGDVAEALENVAASIEEDPYLIANPTGFWTPPAIDPPGRLSSETIFDAYDAVRKYAALPPAGSEEIEANYPEYWAAQTEYWRFLAAHHDTAFIPTVMPGMNDREIEWDRVHHDVLDLSPDEFRTVCQRSLDYVDPELDAVVITSWNEFPEGTTIEPTEEYGHRRLNTVRETLGKRAVDPIPVDDYTLVELDFNRTVRPDDAPDVMRLSFFLEAVKLESDDGAIRTYDVGTLSDEPPFVSGAYVRATHGERTGRWLGGPAGKAAFYVHPGAVDAKALVLTGRPIDPGGIVAALTVEGASSERVTFDEPGSATYRVPVRPD